jgi:hypothetical protein
LRLRQRVTPGRGSLEQALPGDALVFHVAEAP